VARDLATCGMPDCGELGGKHCGPQDLTVITMEIHGEEEIKREGGIRGFFFFLNNEYKFIKKIILI
jgi:hypothetical protein